METDHRTQLAVPTGLPERSRGFQTLAAFDRSIMVAPLESSTTVARLLLATVHADVRLNGMTIRAVISHLKTV